PSPMDRLDKAAPLWDWYSRVSLRRPWTLLAAATLIFAACLPFAVRLYKDLHTDLRELLPQSAPAAVGLVELEKRIGGLSHLAIVVQTDDLKAGEHFVDALGAKLKELPPS